MTVIDGTTNWTDWINAHGDADDSTKLDTLRKFIRSAASTGVRDSNFSATWANKKLLKLGVTDLLVDEQKYNVTREVTGKLTFMVYATSRAEALASADAKFQRSRDSWRITDVVSTSDSMVTAGPEDPDPAAAAADDAPTTVEATLIALREVIMLAVIAGPHICEGGANEVLESFGLEPIPARSRFNVIRPVEVEMVTTIEAYDEASAARVAEWRWENGRSAYLPDVKGAVPTGDPVVSAK